MLPISPFIPEIIQGLKQHTNLVLQAEPGAGKSTALPLALLQQLDLKGKKILLLEPRRVAVKAISFYLAKQLGEPVGKQIGYQIKNEKKRSSETKLEIVTEGILTRRLQADPELHDVALVIFDEFHERSVYSDLSLMLCMEVQETLREDLKLLVMSATMNTQMLSNYMGHAEVIECPGRSYPVTINYQAPKHPNLPIEQQLLSALRTALGLEKAGDILIFLPGQAEIKRCIARVKEHYAHAEIVLLPLYGGLSLTDQERALERDQAGRRKIIFATNIAETSLTIEGVTCVIDSGLERQMLYDAASGMSRLETKTISKASAQQRSGRAGRTQAGTCIRLWSEAKHHSLSDYQIEEICVSDLCSSVLELFSWGCVEYQNISWLTPPPEAHFNAAKKVLRDLNLIDTDNRVTELGKLAVALPVHPRIAHMLLACESVEEQLLACDLAALISEQDILFQNKDCDLDKRLIALKDYRENSTNTRKFHGLNQTRAKQVISSAKSLHKLLPKLGDQLKPWAAKLLLSAFPDRLAKLRSNGSGRYLMANGKGAFLFEEDPLFDSPWLIIIDCDAQRKEGRIYSALSISQDDVINLLGDQVIEEDHFDIDLKTHHISGSRQKRIGAIALASQAITDIPADAFSRCLKQLIEKQGLKVLNWSQACEEWLARATWLGQYLADFPVLTKQSLIEDMESWLLPYLSDARSMKALKEIDILKLLMSSIDWNDQQRLNKEAPTHYVTPNDKKVPIRYDSDQGPTVSVILQEVFGELTSPKLAANKIPLRFELLSPARRPIQTTSDLANFWNSSYFEVAKDMKGKYPKHRWPDKPLEEKAGRSIKRKS